VLNSGILQHIFRDFNLFYYC